MMIVPVSVKRLKEWMEKKSLTQKGLSSRLGISQGQVSKILRRQKRANLKVATKIQKLTGIPSELWVWK